MHAKNSATRITDLPYKITNKAVAFIFINTNAVLHTDRNIHGVNHGLHTISHQSGLFHQTRAKSATLNPL